MPESDSDPAAPGDRLLRSLYGALSDASFHPTVGGDLAQFLAGIRSIVHPQGQRELKRVSFGGRAEFEVDVGDRLGLDFYYQLYRELPEAWAFLKAFPSEGHLVDVGANFGFFSVLAAQTLSSLGRVDAIEPHPHALDLLRTNVGLNRVADRVTVWDVAAGEVDTTRDFHFAAETAFSGFTDTGRAHIDSVAAVKVRSLDSLAQECGWFAIDALKVDVEGFEHLVLQGAPSILTRSHDVIVLLEVSRKNLDTERRAGLLRELIECTKLGLQAWTLDWQAGRPKQVQKINEVVENDIGNVFLVRSESAAFGRLSTAVNEIFALLATGAGDPLEAPMRAAMATRQPGRIGLADPAKKLKKAQLESGVRRDVIQRLEKRLKMVEEESAEHLRRARELEKLNAQNHHASKTALGEARIARRLEAELKTLLAKAQTELEQRKASLDELTTRWTEAQRNSTEYKLAWEKAQLKLAVADHLEGELRQLLDAANQKLQNREEAIGTLSIRFKESQRELQSRFEALQDLKRRWRESQDALGAEKLLREHSQLEVASVRHRAHELEQLLNAAQEKMQKRQNELNDLNRHFLDAKGRGDTLETMLLSAHAELTERKRSLADLSQRWLVAEGNARAEREAAEMMTDQYSAARERGDQLEKMLVTANTRDEAQKKKLEDVASRLSASVSNLSETERVAQSLKARLDVALATIAGREREIVTLKEDLERRKMELEYLTTRFDRLTRQFSSKSELARQWWRLLKIRQPD